MSWNEPSVADEAGTLTVTAELANAGNGSSPAANDQEWHNHLGGHTAMHTHKDWPLGVLVHVAGPLLMSMKQIMLAPSTSSSRVGLAYKVSLQFTRVGSMKVELSFSRAGQILHEGRTRCESFSGGLLLETWRCIVVGVGSSMVTGTGSDGSSAGTITSSHGGSRLGGWSGVAFSHAGEGAKKMAIFISKKERKGKV